MILSDGTIRRLLAAGRIVIDPLEESFIQPASVDVRLDRTFLAFRRHTTTDIDPWNTPDSLMEPVHVAEGDSFILHPGEFVLGTTFERLTLPDDIVARIEGKSSLGRLGLLIHATAGFVDPGWTNGQITLELSNVAPLPIRLWPGMKIAQFSFMQMDAPAERPYGHPDLGSKYQGQSGPVASRYRQNRASGGG
jgi:dCTP deaminase